MNAAAPEDIERLSKSLFLDALEIAPEQWPEFLNRVCDDNTELRSRLERLLRAHLVAGSIHGADDDLPATTVHPSLDLETPGEQIGPFKLREQIGEGGMGLVFVAEQMAPVRRQVALKVCKPGMDTKEVMARFEAERQALAVMDHPNIAKVFDAGTTDSGRPYFVMELVRGIPITEYCEKARLGTRERLKLFITVCQAVQHAHMKGIIHRDIKPTNVMVTLHDGEAVPKVIDFGIAKAIGHRLTEHTVYTQYAQLIGTPLYMSPEQAELSGLDIDTRTDVYSLGVLLYELLTGTTPFDRQTLHEKGLDEFRRLLREQEPPRPSARISTLDAAAQSTLALTRGLDPRQLTRSLKGELDWIVMKALEKDRNRRYESASDLAHDVERFLNDEPVRACPPSPWYRLQKALRRHRTTAISVGLVALSLVLGIVGTAWQAVRATEERNEKEQARRAAVENETRALQERDRAEANFRKVREAVDRVFTLAAEKMADDPGMEHIRRALLEDALEFYQGFLHEKGTDPEIRHETARASLRVGQIQTLLGRLNQAEQPLLDALDLLQELTADHPAVFEYRYDVTVAHDCLSVLYASHMLARNEESLQHMLITLNLRKELLNDHPNKPWLRQRVATDLALVAMRSGRDNGDIQRAEEYYRASLAAWQELQAKEPDSPAVLGGIAFVRQWRGLNFMAMNNLDDAERELREARVLYEDLAARHPETHGRMEALVRTKADMAELLLQKGKPDEAEPLLREVVELRQARINAYPNHFDEQRRLINEYAVWAASLHALGRMDEAVQVLQQRMALIQEHGRRFPHAHSATYNDAWTTYNLGLLLHHLGRFNEAVEKFRAAKVNFEESLVELPDAHSRLHALGWFLADCPAVQFRDPPRAVELAKKALQLAPNSGRYWHALAVAQARAGDWRGAITSDTKAMELTNGGDARHWFVLAMAHAELGDKDEARKWYDRAVPWTEENRPHDEELHRLRAEVAQRLGINPQEPEQNE